MNDRPSPFNDWALARFTVFIIYFAAIVGVIIRAMR